MIIAQGRGTVEKMRGARFLLSATPEPSLGSSPHRDRRGLRVYLLGLSLGVAFACAGRSGSSNCAAIGDDVLPELPLFGPTSQIDCEQDGDWTDEVVRLEDALSVEIGRDTSSWTPLLRARSGGMVAFLGDRLVGLDDAGAVEWETSYSDNRQLRHGTFAVGSDDRVYVSDDFGSDAKIVIFDASTGLQVRQFIISYDDFSAFAPVLALRGDELWLTHINGDTGFEGSFIGSRLSHYDGEGELLSSVDFEHDDFEQPETLAWVDEQTLAAASWRSVYTLDADTGEIGWRVVDSGEFDFVPARALAVTDTAVVVANNVRSEGSGASVWRVVGYGVGSGEQLWTQEFIGAGNGQELDLDVLPDGSVVFVGSDYYSPQDGQPMIVIIDADGELAAGERLAVEGAATSAVVDGAGSLYVMGGSGTTDSFRPEFERVFWLRRYDAPLY